MFQKLDGLIKAIETTYFSSSSIIDTSDVAGYGRHKPENWYSKRYVKRYSKK